MGVAASGKCRILITMRFKVQQKGGHQGTKNSMSALQVQGRHAFGTKGKIYITDFVALLKIIFFS